MATVQGSVQTFTNALVAARAAQQAEEGGNYVNSSAVEAARLMEPYGAIAREQPDAPPCAKNVLLNAIKKCTP